MYYHRYIQNSFRIRYSFFFRRILVFGKFTRIQSEAYVTMTRHACYALLLYHTSTEIDGLRIEHDKSKFGSIIGSYLKYTLYVGTHSVTVTLGTG